MHIINFLFLVIDIRQEVGKVEASGRIENTMKMRKVGVVTIKVEHQWEMKGIVKRENKGKGNERGGYLMKFRILSCAN